MTPSSCPTLQARRTGQSALARRRAARAAREHRVARGRQPLQAWAPRRHTLCEPKPCRRVEVDNGAPPMGTRRGRGHGNRRLRGAPATSAAFWDNPIYRLAVLRAGVLRVEVDVLYARDALGAARGVPTAAGLAVVELTAATSSSLQSTAHFSVSLGQAAVPDCSAQVTRTQHARPAATRGTGSTRRSSRAASAALRVQALTLMSTTCVRLCRPRRQAACARFRHSSRRVLARARARLLRGSASSGARAAPLGAEGRSAVQAHPTCADCARARRPWEWGGGR